MASTPFNQWKDLTAEQLAMEDDFIQYVLHPTPDQRAYWDAFIKTYPQKEQEIQEAQKMIQKLHFEDHFPPQHTKDKVWERLQVSLHHPKPRKRLSFPIYWKAIAAVVIAGLFIGGYFLWHAAQYQTVKTAYGQIKTIELPDHSKITLNANSSIRYKKYWKQAAVRKIWIKGEAFFKVSHQHSGKKPFLVFSNDVKVEVLGTSFNIKNRHDKTAVVLKSGKVRLGFQKGSHKDMMMKPGEIVTVSKSKDVKKKPTDIAAQISWKKRKWQFHNTPLPEVIQQIEDTYGLQIKMKDSTLASETISGTLSAQNEDILLKAIATILNVHIEKINTNTILITH